MIAKWNARVKSMTADGFTFNFGGVKVGIL
jgi:hypothetical protein